MSASEEERWAKKRRKLARYEENMRALQDELAGTSSAPTPGKDMTQWCRKFSPSWGSRPSVLWVFSPATRAVRYHSINGHSSVSFFFLSHTW